MLKLLKYEFIQSWRNYIYVFLAYFVISVVAGTSISRGNVPGALETILLTSFVFLAFGILLGVIIAISKNFTTSMFQKQGYLTLTLPVSTHELLMSKVFSSVIWIIINGFIFVIGVILFMSAADVLNFLSPETIIEDIVTLCSQLEFSNCLITILSGMQSIIQTPLTIFACLSVAHSCYIRNHRVVIAIVLFFLYGAIVGNLTLSFSNLFYSGSFLDYTTSLHEFLYFDLFTSLIEIVFLYGVTWYFIEKKIELH